MKLWKNFTILIFFLVGVLVSGEVASALDPADITLVTVEANDVMLSNVSPKDVKVTDELELLIVFDSNINASDLHIEAVLRGSELDLVEDIDEVFEVVAGNRYDVRLTLDLPKRLEQGRYDLKLRFDENVGSTVQYNLPLDIGSARHALQIKDVIVDPDNQQKANRAILTKVRIKNYGEKDEESVKIKVSIPELGLSASDYIDEIESGDSVTSTELYMRIPEEAKTGQYDLVVSVEYNDGDKVEREELTYMIIGSDDDGAAGNSGNELEPRTVIAISQEPQEATAGVGGVVYPITITNEGSESRTYTIGVEGVEQWGNAKITPRSTEIIEGGETKSLYVYVSAKESASEGEYMFSVSVKSDNTVLKQIPLKTKVVSAGGQATSKLVSRSTLVRVLQVGFITFIVLLVILGLIIGFNKLRGEEIEEPEEGSEKYY